MKSSSTKIIRAALYIRVSTEEQALHGDSLAAQEEELVRFAKENNMKVINIYRDEGNSARQPAKKRKVMVELLEDVRAGKIDIIIFTKLDRWFRNVREYHWVQSVLDEKGVTWRATLEDYNTASADGRFKVNIMLSVAENESDRTSERIRFVFESKRRKKEYCFGGMHPPFGYKTEVIDGIRRLVKDPETEPIVNDFWDHVRKYNSVRLAGLFCNEKYGIQRRYKSWTDLFRREYHTGTYKGVEDYCPAYIDRTEWEYLMQSHVKIKTTQRPDRVYLFTGLLRCPGCGATLKATFKTDPNNRDKEYRSYRCNNGQLGMCSYRKTISEIKTEKYLLANIRAALDEYILEVEARGQLQKKKDPEMEIVKINEQIRRLNVVFMAGNISDEDYAKETAALKVKLEKAKQEEKSTRPPDMEVLKNFLQMDFEAMYGTLSPEDKRRMWRSIISEIHYDGTDIKENGIIFRA